MRNEQEIGLIYSSIMDTHPGYKAGFVLQERSICQRGSLKFGTMRFFKGGCYNG